MRLATWNMKRAGLGHPAWDYFRSSEMCPDIALLQEVGLPGPPPEVVDGWEIASARPMTKGGSAQKFLTMILVRKELHPSGLDVQCQMTHRTPWLSELLGHFAGNLLFRQISIPCLGNLNLISAYSPAWSVDSTGLKIGDTKAIKLDQNDSLWVTDLLLAGLKELFNDNPAKPWLIAGDLNLSVTFDAWRKGGRGNAEYLQKMRGLGLVEALAAENPDRLVPTFRNAKDGKEIHQMDHLFLSENFANILRSCSVGNREVIFESEQLLSDHLPIIATLADSDDPVKLGSTISAVAG